jgi:hypothetical protein
MGVPEEQTYEFFARIAGGSDDGNANGFGIGIHGQRNRERNTTKALLPGRTRNSVRPGNDDLVVVERAASSILPNFVFFGGNKKPRRNQSTGSLWVAMNTGPEALRA